MVFKFEQQNIYRLKLNLDANISNTNKQIEILEFIRPITATYTGVISKRLATKLDKALKTQYGFKEYKNYDNKTNEWPNASTYYTNKNYGIIDNYSLNIHYNTAVKVDYNRDSKEYYIRTDDNDKIEFYSFKDVSELLVDIDNKIKYLKDSVIKMTDNLTNIEDIVKTYNQLGEYINDHNESLSHVLHDALRIG